MRRFLVGLLFAGICLGVSHPARGQSTLEFVEPVEHYIFGNTLTIETAITSPLAIDNITLYLHPQGDNPPVIEELSDVSPESVLFTIDLTQTPLPAFSNIIYWFQVELEGGETVKSQNYNFDYEDNRHPWQSLKTEEFEINWIEGDTVFGQTLLNTAYEGLARIQNQVHIPDPQKVTIYVYPSAQELQSTIQLSGQNAEWIAAHADIDAGVILVSIPQGPAQTLEIKRQIPHELAHVMLYQKIGDAYDNLPNWLNEGLASTAELFPNPDYTILLEKAHERELLISIEDLCYRFPSDINNFQLAYAESASFVWYLQGEFGTDGIENLIEAYEQGVSCERGIEIAFEKTFSELERNWRLVTFNENPLLYALAGLFPWMIVFGFLLLPSLALFIGDILKQRMENLRS